MVGLGTADHSSGYHHGIQEHMKNFNFLFFKGSLFMYIPHFPIPTFYVVMHLLWSL